MRIKILFICIMLGGQWSWAQSLVATAGGFQSNTETLLQWSIGETFVGSFNNSDQHIAIGFQQPEFSKIVSVENLISTDDVGFYPNPFHTFLYVNTPEKVGTNYRIIVTHMQGQRVEAQVEADEGRLRIDANEWPAGVYLLQFINKDQVFVSKVTKL